MPRGIGRKIFGVVLVVLLLVVGAYALGYAGPTEVTGDWEVSEIAVTPEQQELVDDVLREQQMTVSFLDGELTMTGPCNSQAARFFRVGDRLLSVPGFGTSNLCHWDGYTDAQISKVDRLFQHPGSWLSTIEEDLVSEELVWVRGDVTLVLSPTPAG